MSYQIPLPFFKDEARRKSLEEIFENIFVSFEEEEELESKLDSYLKIVTQLKDIFLKNYSVKVGENEYSINIKTLNEEILTESIKKFENKWVISIDESQHEEEKIAGSVFYRNSLAFGFKLSKDKKDERILSLISTIKFYEDSEIVKRKIDLQTYIQNLLVGIYASAILISEGEKIHSILIDGPLVRMLGPFLTVKFTEEEIRKLFTIDKNLDKENLPLEKIEILDKKLSLHDIATGKLFDVIRKNKDFIEVKNYLNAEQELKNSLSLKKGEIPGIVIYFFLLKILIDLSKKYNFYLISCVKSTERTTEFLKVYFINSLIKYLEDNKKSDLYKEVQSLLKKKRIKLPEDAEYILSNFLKLNIKDDQILTFTIDYYDEKVNYLEPVEIRRHRSVSKNEEDIREKNYFIPNWKFGSADMGIQDKFLEKIILDKIFRDYTILMSYLRTSELKAPLRIEFPRYDEDKMEDIIASIYLFSYPYQHYGIPIMLKYVDDLVRVPSQTFKTISKGFVFEKLIKTLLSQDLSISEIKPIINSILDLFKRDFLSRGGIL